MAYSFLKYVLSALPILIALFLTPLIMALLNNYLKKKYPINKNFRNYMSYVIKHEKLKRKIELYQKIELNLFIFFWGLFMLLLFFYIFDGNNGSSIFVILFLIVTISSVGALSFLLDWIFVLVFKKLNPEININLFIVYFSSYNPNEKISMVGSNVNTLELNRKIKVISIAMFIPSFILILILIFLW